MEYILMTILGAILSGGAYITGKTHGKLEAFKEIDSYKNDIPIFDNLGDCIDYIVRQDRKVH